MTAKPAWRHLGICHADTAMLLIGDPCYSAHDNHPEHPIHHWGAFCDLLEPGDKTGQRGLQLNHPHTGNPGCGVVVRTGYDGQFSVDGRFTKNGDLIELRLRPD